MVKNTTGIRLKGSSDSIVFPFEYQKCGFFAADDAVADDAIKIDAP